MESYETPFRLGSLTQQNVLESLRCRLCQELISVFLRDSADTPVCRSVLLLMDIRGIPALAHHESAAVKIPAQEFLRICVFISLNSLEQDSLVI